jgi:cytochrome c peroxidase
MSHPLLALLALVTAARPVNGNAGPAPWEIESPLRPLPAAPLGVRASFEELPFTVTPERVRLGRWLFFDPRLSVDGTVACATCHRPEHGFSEPTGHSRGVGGQAGTRKSLPILNVAFGFAQGYFWDGRARSLVDQAKAPLVNPVEMGGTPASVAASVAAVPGYRTAFREAFGDDRIDIDRVAEAIAAYEATRLSGGSRFDRFRAGDAEGLTAEEKEGLEIFFGRGRCSVCHSGPSFSDGAFHDVGIGRRPAGAADAGRDPGRYAVTGRASDRGAFRTPTLRDVSRRAPYMHDGSIQTLDEAVRVYQVDGDDPRLDPAMREVDIGCRDVAPLVAFLRALDGTGFEDHSPERLPQ